MPLDIKAATANLAASAHSATAASTPSLLERVETSCTAMMSYLTTMSSKPTDSSGSVVGRGKTTFTPEQQEAYISRLRAQNQAKDQTIRSLQNALSNAASGTGGRGRGTGSNRGGRGRGRGHGRGKTPDGDPVVENIEIFMATMDDGIAQQLATEAAMDIDSDAVESSTSVPRLASAQMPLSDSGEDEAPPAMVDPPENEPPVYLHPGGPPPSPPPRKISWLLLSVGVLVAFVAVLIVAAALDSLPSFSSLSNTTILGGGALLACSNFSRRRFALEKFSPWIVVLGLVLVLFGVCQGQPQTLELGSLLVSAIIPPKRVSALAGIVN
jgi:hypothetical protein